MKKIIKIVLTLIGGFSVIFIASTILLHVYTEEIQSVVLKYLNKNINTKVDVGDIRYTFLRHFPYLSATFRSVSILSSEQYIQQMNRKDTLLKADEIILDMNIYNALIYRDIKIRRIIVDKGTLRLEEGKNVKNWEIWKNRRKQTKSTVIRIVRIYGLHYSYMDLNRKKSVKGFIEKAEWAGGMFQEKGGKVLIKHGNLCIENENKTVFTASQRMTISMRMQMNKDSVKIMNGKLVWNDMTGIFNGAVGRTYNDGYHFQLDGKPVDAEKVLKAFYKKKTLETERIKVLGKISFNGTLNGNINKPFLFNTKINLRGGGFDIEPGKGQENIKIERWSAICAYRMGEKNPYFDIRVQPAGIHYRNSSITAEATWEKRNKKYPLTIQLNGNVMLTDMKGWIKDEKDIIAGGQAAVKLKLRMPADVLKSFTLRSLPAVKTEGNISFQKLALTDPAPLYVEKLVADFLPDYVIGLNGSGIRWAGSMWKVKGSMLNLINYLEGKTPLIFQTNLSGASLDIEKAIAFFTHLKRVTQDKNGKNTRSMLPVVDSKILLDTFRYRRFNAERITGLFSYHDPVIALHNLSFETMNGHGEGQMEWNLQTDGRALVKTYAEISHINVHDLFFSFNNFGQNFIRSGNLNGDISGNISFQSMFDSRGKIIKPTILSDSYLVITNGELIGFEPLYKLSKFIRLSELKDIRFSKLENEIFIHDQQVRIPDMQVNSSALNLFISGTHHFDKRFDYRIRILLSDYLARKARDANNDNTQFGIVEDQNEGQSNLFLRYRGDEHASKITYDAGRVKKKISTDIKDETRRLKAILHEEMGLFKSDSVSGKSNQESKRKFNVEWPEEKKEKKKLQDTTGKKKFSIIWEEEVPDTSKKKKEL